MGIRYYAYPVRPDQTAAATDYPEAFLGADPLGDAWGIVYTSEHGGVMDAKPRPHMLYLDKAWSYLQALTHPADADPLPSHALFEGRVTFTDCGWDAWIRALSPEQVAEIAADLTELGADDFAELFARAGEERFDDDGRGSYLYTYLCDARDFVVDLAERGWGLVYRIG